MAAAAPDTWMPFWIGPYLANTLHLNRAQHGSYLLLILAAWKAGGSLPDDDATLATIAKCSAKEWRGERATYAAFFSVADGRWTHDRVVAELEKARAFLDQRSNAGKASAEQRRAQRKGNGHSTETQRETQRQVKTSPSPSPSPSPSSETTTESVTTSALAREPVSRAQLLTEEWEPTEDEVKGCRAELSWIGDELWTSRMRAFRDWCDASATRTFNPASTWRGFMRQTRKPHEGKQWSKPDAQALPAAEPWEARITGFQKSGFWLPAWGPKPGEPGCPAPKHLTGGTA